MIFSYCLILQLLSSLLFFQPFSFCLSLSFFFVGGVVLFSLLHERVTLLLLLLLSHFSRVQLCATPETAAHQAPLSLGFSRQEHWSGLPFPSPMHVSEK